MIFLSFMFKKDVRRLKGFLVLWIVFLLMQFMTETMSLSWIAEDMVLYTPVYIFMRVIRCAVFLLPLIIIPLLIQEDSPVNENAFWVTRPITGLSLLTTKMCFIVLFFVVLPLLSECVLLGRQGFGMGMLMLAVPEIILEELMLVTPFVLIAAWMKSMRGYLVVMFFSLFVLIAIPIFGGVFTESFTSIFVLQKDVYTVSDMYLLELVQILFWLYIALLFKFIPKQSSKVAYIFIFVFCVIPLLSFIWNVIFPEIKKDESKKIVAPFVFHVRTDLNHVVIQDALRHKKEENREKEIFVKQTVEGLPPTHFTTLTCLHDVFMEYSETERLESRAIHVDENDVMDDEQFRLPLQAVLDQGYLVNPYTEKFTRKEIFRLYDTSFQKYKDRVGTYKSRAKYNIYQYQQKAELPLEPGYNIILGSQQLGIYDVMKTSTGVSIYVVQKNINLSLHHQDAVLNNAQDYRQVYLLYNTKRKQAFLPEVSDKFFVYTNQMLGRRRLFENVRRLDFTHVNGRNKGLPHIDEMWLQDAVLLRIDAEKIGKQSKDIKLNNFYLPGQSK